MNSRNPHQNQPILSAGKALEQARAALVMVHGRGATAASILPLAELLAPPDFAILAPQAANQTWYPYSFLMPIAQNEPGITSGLAVLAGLVEQITAAGIPAEKIALAGFSQGACLALEFTARHARRYGAILGFSGGLIGPDGTPRDYPGSLAGTPIFLGCSDVDFHIPKGRVELTADAFEQLGAEVSLRLYPGMGHTINEDELQNGQRLLKAILDE